MCVFFSLQLTAVFCEGEAGRGIVAEVVLSQSSSYRIFYSGSRATCKSAHSSNTRDLW